MPNSSGKVWVPFGLILVVLGALLVRAQLHEKDLQQRLSFKEVSAQSAFLMIELENLRQVGNGHLGSTRYLPTLRGRVGDLKKRFQTIQFSLAHQKEWGRPRATLSPLTQYKLSTLQTVLEEVLKDKRLDRQSLDMPVPSTGDERALGEIRLGLIQLLGTGPDRKNVFKDDLIPPPIAQKQAVVLKKANGYLNQHQTLQATLAFCEFLLLSQKELTRKTEVYAQMMNEKNIFRASRILQTQGYFDTQIKTLMVPVVQALFELSQAEPSPGP